MTIDIHDIPFRHIEDGQARWLHLIQHFDRYAEMGVRFIRLNGPQCIHVEQYILVCVAMLRGDS